MNFAPLTPELYCRNFAESLEFYNKALGFVIVYLTPGEKFAYLDRHGAQIMMQELTEKSDWMVEKPTYPFGCGLNLKIYTDNVLELYQSLMQKGYKFVQPLEDQWYPKTDIFVGNRQFIIQDPDGYLLRFSQDLGEKTAQEIKNLKSGDGRIS